MKRVHLLRVERPASELTELIEAIRADGGRVGWLELREPAPAPPELEEAARLGVLRAVAVGAEKTITVKPRRGATALRDLLREHFRGCRLVLVRGEVEAPLLTPDGPGWTVTNGGEARSLSTRSLTRALRRPDPFGAAKTS